MKTCRFCDISNGISKNTADTIFAHNEKYFAISSVGALVEGWSLIVPRQHCCSMKNIYADKSFIEFSNTIAKALKDCYGPIIAFEHGPNREGSETSCGTDHAHIHLVPYHSIASLLDNTGLSWQACYSNEVNDIVRNNEYLFYVEINETLEKSVGRVHILEKPISQFFRRIIADDLEIAKKYNYKVNPDTELTFRTIEGMVSYFREKNGGGNV